MMSARGLCSAKYGLAKVLYAGAKAGVPLSLRALGFWAFSTPSSPPLIAGIHLPAIGVRLALMSFRTSKRGRASADPFAAPCAGWQRFEPELRRAVRDAPFTRHSDG